MDDKQLKLLVALQDLDTMIREISQEEEMGFQTNSIEKLRKAREELKLKLKPIVMRTYERLAHKYKMVVVPVKDGTCLGCFIKLPVSVAAKGKEELSIINCENCGRFLYWLE